MIEEYIQETTRRFVAYFIAFLSTLVCSTFALASEMDSLLNSEHNISWAYYRSAQTNNGKWFISNIQGTTYALGRNNIGHTSWVTIANARKVASLDLNNNLVTLNSTTTALTPSDSYLAISLVGGYPNETVYNSNANDFARLVSGKTLNLDWYFFKVNSTGMWFIVLIDGTNSYILRLQLNSTLTNYDWQNPLDGFASGFASGIPFNTRNSDKLEKVFFFDDYGNKKVRFRIHDFTYTSPAYSANPGGRGWCYPQCVEFVKENLGLPSGRTYAKEYWTNPHENYRNFAQGNTIRAPRPGDILVWGGNLNPNTICSYTNGRRECVCDSTGCGHVAIVRSVDLKTGVLTRVDANWRGGCAVEETTMTIAADADGKYTIGGSGSDHLLGWQSVEQYFP